MQRCLPGQRQLIWPEHIGQFFPRQRALPVAEQVGEKRTSLASGEPLLADQAGRRFDFDASQDMNPGLHGALQGFSKWPPKAVRHSATGATSRIKEMEK